MKRLILLAVLVSGMTASAASTVVRGYSCDVAVIAEGVDGGAQVQTIKRPLLAPGGHGGEPVELTFGSHKVMILADGIWRSISWWRDGKLVAETVTANSEVVQGQQAIIVYNPENQDEEAYLSCTAE